jgi:RNA-binding protein 5/10
VKRKGKSRQDRLLGSLCFVYPQNNQEDSEVSLAGRLRKEERADLSRDPTKPADFSPVVTEEATYKDRARERRTVFGTEKMIAPALSIKPVNEKTSPAQLTESREPAPILDETSKGGAMLAKMGWTAGKGLGANQSGRVEPVEAKLFAQGAGLGGVAHESATSAAIKRAMKSDYLEHARQQTRLRYK